MKILLVLLAAGCGPRHPASISNATADPDAIVVRAATEGEIARDAMCPLRGGPAPELELPLARFLAAEHPEVADARIAIEARSISGQITIAHQSFEQTYCTRVVPGRPRVVLVAPGTTTILDAFD